MTNEEKAEELAKDFGIDYYAKGSKHPIDYSFDECYKSALEMAEWKDQQFREYLEKKKDGIGNAIMIFGHDMKKYAKIDLLKEIINELFGGE